MLFSFSSSIGIYCKRDGLGNQIKEVTEEFSVPLLAGGWVFIEDRDEGTGVLTQNDIHRNLY